MTKEGETCSAQLFGMQGHLPLASPFIIGRATRSDAIVAEAQVSRRHAMLFEYGGRWWVTDMGSRNGVMVNGLRLHHARPLRDGDQMRVGTQIFTFSTTDSPRSSLLARDGDTELSPEAAAAPSPGAVVCELVVASTAGEILEGEKAARWFFGRAVEHPLGVAHPLLPPVVRRWLSARATAGAAGGEPLELEGMGRRVVVVLSRTQGMRHYLLLREESAAVAMARLQALGLTQREAQVMHWVCEGKTNPEIASILEITPHTVNRHMEHILEKLGVDSRQKAIITVMERLAS